MPKIEIKEKRILIPKRKATIFLFVVIVVLASFLRLWHLNETPPGVWYDEAYNALDALQASENNDYKIFYPENYGREGLYINVLALSFKFFGVNNFALRFPSALFGILTIIGFYLLLRKLKLYHTTVLLAVFALATSFYHINFSRIAFRAIMVSFLLIWSFYFFFKAISSLKKKEKSTESSAELTTKNNSLKMLFTGKEFNLFLAGLLTGLGLHTYIAYRVVPLVFIIFLVIFLFVYSGFLKKYWKGILLFLLGAMISAGPLLFYFKNHPSAFSGRTDAVSIFNSPEMSTGRAFVKSLAYHLQSIVLVGDSNQRHNYNSFPLLPSVWGLFFIIGFFISLKEVLLTFVNRFRKKEPTRLFLPSLLGQTTFWVMLIPGVLSLEGIPHFLRIIGVTPAVFLLTALPFEYIRRLYLHLKNSPFYKLKLWRWKIMQLAFIGLVITFILAGLSQIYLYFGLWGPDPKTAEAFQNDWYVMGQFIKEQPLKKQNYLVLNKNIHLDKNNRHNIPEKSLLFVGYPIIKNYSVYGADEDFTDLFNKVDCSNSQFILQSNTPLLPLKKIKNYCRNLTLQQIPLNKNTPTKKVWVLK